MGFMFGAFSVSLKDVCEQKKKKIPIFRVHANALRNISFAILIHFIFICLKYAKCVSVVNI